MGAKTWMHPHNRNLINPTIFDQTAFSNAFSAADPVADWDGDGMFTVFDFTEFGNTFALGCP